MDNMAIEICDSSHECTNRSRRNTSKLRVLSTFIAKDFANASNESKPFYNEVDEYPTEDWVWYVNRGSWWRIVWKKKKKI